MTWPDEEISAQLAGRIWQTAVNFPDNTALELGGRLYSYSELYQAASSVCNAIRELDDPSPFVAVMADKSFACYSGILGILLAGKAYLPLNPRFPSNRNLYMMEKAKIRVVVAGENSDEELERVVDYYQSEIFIIFPEETEKHQFPLPLPKKVEPDYPAYLLFTSGTTGKPKGVPVSNQNVISYLDNIKDKFDIYPEDRLTQIFDLTFDLSVHDMFLAWTSGSCLVVADDNSSFAMSRFIREKGPTLWFSVPSMVTLMDRMRLLKPAAFPSIRLSFFCGEALQNKTARAWKNAVPQSRVINLYGPTEATIAISSYELPEQTGTWKQEIGTLAIGSIFNGNGFMIIKEDPSDDHGELCLEGLQVVEKYLDNEQADSDAFFIDNETGQKFYRTGDIVKTDEDGDIYYLGRKDSEVKISGYRVNLKEIEYVLGMYKSVDQAVVIFDQADDNSGTLLAFILSTKTDQDQLEKDLDAHCRSNLPWFMAPGKYIFVNEIPLNANGKVDKAILRQKYSDGQ
jgi:amino acid adenylation domain-containing protein